MSIVEVAKDFRLRFNNIPGVGRPGYLANISGLADTPTLGVILTNNPGPETLFIVDPPCYPSHGSDLVYSNTASTNVILNPYQIRLAAHPGTTQYYIKVEPEGTYDLDLGQGDCSIPNAKTFKFITYDCTDNACAKAGSPIKSGDSLQLQDTATGSVIAVTYPLSNPVIVACDPQKLDYCSNVQAASSIMTIEVPKTTELLPMVPTTTYPIVIVVRCNCKNCKC